jgi:stage II sporulation protein AA (anti-sigma F factor antagonist)
MSIDSNEEVHEVNLSGRLDSYEAKVFSAKADALMTTSVRKVVVNLDQVTFLCSAALRVIVLNHRKFKAEGRKFVVGKTSKDVDFIFATFGIGSSDWMWD